SAHHLVPLLECSRLRLPAQPWQHVRSGNASRRKKFPRWNQSRLSPLVRPHADAAGDPAERAMESIGRKLWAIAEGYIPSQSAFADPALVSHETACILNATDQMANVRITVFFADREPIGPYRISVAARRTRHLRFNDLN